MVLKGLKKKLSALCAPLSGNLLAGQLAEFFKVAAKDGLGPALAAAQASPGLLLAYAGVFTTTIASRLRDGDQEVAKIAELFESLQNQNSDIQRLIQSFTGEGEVYATINGLEQHDLAELTAAAVENRLSASPAIRSAIRLTLGEVGVFTKDDLAALVGDSADGRPASAAADILKLAEIGKHPEIELPVDEHSDQYPLLYTSRRTSLLGRQQESRELAEFLHQDDSPFLWWLWTGSGGIGKSRLALELCLESRGSWLCGFLRDRNSFTGWETWQPPRPTLLVVDYCASRIDKIAEMLLALSERAASLKHPVRALLLERSEEGPWWDKLVSRQSWREAKLLDNSRHSLPRRLGALEPEHLWQLVCDTYHAEGKAAPDANKEAILERLRAVDPSGSPLFAALAAIVSIDKGEAFDWDARDLLLGVLDRERARWRQLIGDQESCQRYEQALLLSTMTGGVALAGSMIDGIVASEQANALLPSLATYDHRIHAAMCGAPVRDARQRLLPLLPDILGEFYVLEKGDAEQQSRFEQMKDAAWSLEPRGTYSFLDRSLRDFVTHPALLILVRPPSESGAIDVWAELTSNVMASICAAGEGELAHNLLDLLRSVADSRSDRGVFSERVGRATLAVARQRAEDYAHSDAKKLFEAALQESLPSALEHRASYEFSLTLIALGEVDDGRRRLHELESLPTIDLRLRQLVRERVEDLPQLPIPSVAPELLGYREAFIREHDHTVAPGPAEWSGEFFSRLFVPPDESLIAELDGCGSGEVAMLVGAAGAGKTTLLIWLGLRAARSQNETPVLVRLRTYQSSHHTTLRAYLRDDLRTRYPSIGEDVADRILKNRETLLLLDGLDELAGAEGRHRILDECRAICSDTGARAIISSRPYVIGDLGGDMQVVSVDPLSEQSVRAFVDRFFWAWANAKAIGNPAERASELSHSLMGTIAVNDSLRSLMSNPLLASLACLAHAETGRIPESRTSLYQDVISNVLRRDRTRGLSESLTPAKLSEQDLIRLLRKLAYNTVGRASISIEDVAAAMGGLTELEELGAKDVLTHLSTRSGLIRDVGGGAFQFAHRSLQEFLAAQAMANTDLLAHVEDGSWDSMVEVVAETSEPSERIAWAEKLVERARSLGRENVLAARCAGLAWMMTDDLPRAPETVRQRVVDLAEEFVVPRNVTDASRVAGAGDLVVPVLQYRKSRNARTSVLCIRALGRLGSSRAKEAARSYQDDARATVIAELCPWWRSWGLELEEIGLIRSLRSSGEAAPISLRPFMG